MSELRKEAERRLEEIRRDTGIVNTVSRVVGAVGNAVQPGMGSAVGAAFRGVNYVANRGEVKQLEAVARGESDKLPAAREVDSQPFFG